MVKMLMNLTNIINDVMNRRQEIKALSRDIKFYDNYTWEQEDAEDVIYSLEDLEKELKLKEQEYDKLIQKLEKIDIDI